MSDEDRSPSTGAVDADRRSPHTKMDREQKETDAPSEPGRDVRGKGRQMNEQLRREPDAGESKPG